jgi:hypothetical protein
MANSCMKKMVDIIDHQGNAKIKILIRMTVTNNKQTNKPVTC